VSSGPHFDILQLVLLPAHMVWMLVKDMTNKGFSICIYQHSNMVVQCYTISFCSTVDKTRVS